MNKILVQIITTDTMICVIKTFKTTTTYTTTTITTTTTTAYNNTYIHTYIHTDHLISARRPDLIIINKKKKREFAKLLTLLSRLTTE